jgi:C-terminal processing protease CtpA/Prc
MRSLFIYAGVALYYASASYAQIPGKPPEKVREKSKTLPARPALERRDAETFAAQLSEVVRAAEDKYVRPIPRDTLTTAALRGLYEAAGTKPPATLAADAQKASQNQNRLVTFIADVREKLGNPESLQGDKALRASLRALVKSLDSYSDVLVGERSQKVEYVRGVGLELDRSAGNDALVVKSVTLGGPAQQAGLRPGDQVTHIDGRPAANHQVASGINLDEDQLQLTVHRQGTKASLELTLKPQNFRPETVLGAARRSDNAWEYFIDHERRIGLVRLGALESGSSDELEEVVSTLQEAGLKALILDLRWCPGGYLDDARAITEAFLGEYSLPYFMFPTPANFLAQADVYLDTHINNAVVRYRADPRTNESRPDVWQKHATRSFVNFPIVVLINGETTGGGELIAAVLQDNRRAAILGQRSRGKGSVQTFIDVPIPGTRLKLTNGYLIRPSGKNLHRFPNSKLADDWGVRPDRELEFRVSPELGGKLREWWILVNLRPGSSNESLPLDDPDADPQRQAAVKFLQRILAN